MPFFSIIIPTYNRAELLRETLASVWTQEFTDYEVVIVDDGSTDGTREWLATQGDKVRVFQQANRGAGPARNLAIEHARGEYIAFLDSDDLWFPWTLATYAKVIAEHGSPSFITAHVTKFEHPHAPTNIGSGPMAVKVFADYLASGDEWRWYGMSSFVVKRSTILAVGGFTMEAVNNEDTDFSLRLGAVSGFVHIQSPVTMAYREHSGGIRHVTRKSVAGALMLMSQDNAGRFPGGAERAGERWRILGRHLRPCALRCLQDGLRAEGWQLYWAMFGRHLREGRWKFLAAFPLIAARSALKGLVERDGESKAHP